jgi:ParB family chromosome partitioning protein
MSRGADRYIFKAPISRIGVRPRRRPIDQAHVANLAVSFQEIGQRTPISLNLVGPDEPARDEFTYWLNAGGHRLGAAKLLQWADLDAILEDDDALTARIAEVDENLIRRDYTALERAQALAARLEAWGARYPERIVLGDDGNARAKRGRPVKMGHGAPITAPSSMGFADDAAAKVNLSIDTVKRALAIYRGIPAGLQAALAGTPIASNPGLLRQLAALGDADEQAKVAELLIAGRTKNVAAARAIAAGNTPVSERPETPTDETVKAFRKLWASATPGARATILEELAGRPKLPGRWTLVLKDQAGE